MELQHYLQDGAGYQARAVLMHLQGRGPIEHKTYTAIINVGRWENGREQGYVVMLTDKKGQQLNIAFFEGRNSDSINAIEWIQSSINTPNIDSQAYYVIPQNEHHRSHSVTFAKYAEMADLIYNRLVEHYTRDLN